jgi:hypothetical protein
VRVRYIGPRQEREAVVVYVLRFMCGVGGIVWATGAWAQGQEVADPERSEFGALPALGYSPGYGLGVGVVWTMARFDRDTNPFKWKLDGLLQMNLKSVDGVGLTVPSQNHYLIADVPGLAGGWLRLETRLGFAKMLDAPYYGFGNAASATVPSTGLDAEQQRRFHQFGRTYPNHYLKARMTVYDATTDAHKKRLEVLAQYVLRYEDVDLYGGSLLEDHASDPAWSGLVYGTDAHLLFMVGTGLLWDTRDHEFAPTRGTFSQILLDASPGVQEDLAFTHATVDTAWFQQLAGERVVLAARVRGDVYAGDVPVYAYVEYGAVPEEHLRGIQYGRYRGNVELVENLEIRTKLMDLNMGSQRFNLGVTGFFDAGRVWAATSPVTVDGEDLDGAQGMHTGVGGGPRLQWGETFLIRGDYAVSPSDSTSGFYLTIGHRF